MLSSKRIAVLSGIFMASVWLAVGCGTTNSIVPPLAAGGVAGAYGSCAYGLTYYPGGSVYGGYGSAYGTCVAGYTFNGSTCTCATTGYYGGSAYGGSPYGYGGGAYSCPIGTIYYANYGCH